MSIIWPPIFRHPYSWFIVIFCFHIETQPCLYKHINGVLMFWIILYILRYMQHQYSLGKYIQSCHSSIICLLSRYFSAQNLLAIISLFLSVPSFHSCLVYWIFRGLGSCAQFFLFQNYRSDDFSLFLWLLLIPRVIDYFLLNIGLLVHFLYYNNLIRPNW